MYSVTVWDWFLLHATYEDPVELLNTLQFETLCCNSAPEIAQSKGVALPQRRHWRRILRRVILYWLLEIRTNTAFCHIGLELPRGETKEERYVRCLAEDVLGRFNANGLRLCLQSSEDALLETWLLGECCLKQSAWWTVLWAHEFVQTLLAGSAKFLGYK